MRDEIVATRILVTIFLFFSLLSAAFALNTHVNISISETVNQNVTYAQDFTLQENRTYSLIEGVIVVHNPGAESIYDINIRLDNTTTLATNVNHVAGRNGTQVIYPNGDTNITNLTGNINASANYTLPFDIDEDGLDDFVTLNDTHLIFHVSSEYNPHTFAFYNSTNSSLNLSVIGSVIDMELNITSYREDLEYNDGVIFSYMNISGTTTAGSQLIVNSTEIVFTLQDTSRVYAVLHIPELRSGNSSTFNYNISAVLVDPPLDIDTLYTNPEFQTKVLAGEYFGVLLTATNIATVGDLTLVNITLRAEDVNVSNGSVSELYNFTLHNLSNDSSTSADYTNVDNSSNRTWYWVTNNGTIPVGQSYNISFQIRAPDTVASSGTHLAMTQLLAYEINATGSTLAVGNVRARAAILFNTTKRIVQPSDNLSNRNVTWQSIPTIYTSENITYVVEKVTQWITSVIDPNQLEAGLETDYLPGADINLTTSWTGTPWLFNFTDGSTSSAPPPIVWIKPYWIIKNTQNQIINSSVTVNGTDLYMNYIYVVNGYWLEIQKQVLDSGENRFDILITVRNRGNGHTPQNLTVTVYDFIPSEFTAYNFSPSFDNSSNVTGEFAGIAYQWDAGLRTNLTTSFAPRGDPLGLDYFYINYSVNGSGDFKVSDLYIVGLDPRLVDGASAYQGVSVLSEIASKNTREIFYIVVVVFLIAINIANFLITSKINKKLDGNH